MYFKAAKNKCARPTNSGSAAPPPGKKPAEFGKFPKFPSVIWEIENSRPWNSRPWKKHILHKGGHRRGLRRRAPGRPGSVFCSDFGPKRDILVFDTIWYQKTFFDTTLWSFWYHLVSKTRLWFTQSCRGIKIFDTIWYQKYTLKNTGFPVYALLRGGSENQRGF